jgi:hypothetical protein
MTVDTVDDFEVLEPVDLKKLTSKARSKEVDMKWAERIATLPLGKGFKTTRPDTESVRQFKKRMNAAAAHSKRTLEWTTLDPKKDPNAVEEPKQFIAKVKAIDVTEVTPEVPEPNGETEESPAATGRRR